jgi:hypothetical protein
VSRLGGSDEGFVKNGKGKEWETQNVSHLWRATKILILEKPRRIFKGI